jgi:hypothetical protein
VGVQRGGVKHEIEGAQYRCKECGWNFGDPDAAKSFLVWEATARGHLLTKHLIPAQRLRSVNDFVVPFFIWTTPTGKELVTTSAVR